MLLELNRPVVCLLETMHSQGGISLEAHHYACPDDLRAALEACPVVPFHREPGLKDATIRLVLQALLPHIAEGSPSTNVVNPVYLPSEQTQQRLLLPLHRLTSFICM